MGKAAPFHSATDVAKKLLPFTVIVKDGSPAVQELGVIEVIAGIGFVASPIADFFLQAVLEKNKSTAKNNFVLLETENSLDNWFFINDSNLNRYSLQKRIEPVKIKIIMKPTKPQLSRCFIICIK